MSAIKSPLAQILEDHVEVSYGDNRSDQRCEVCATEWPCDSYKLAQSVLKSQVAQVEIPVALPLHAFTRPELDYIHSLTRVDEKAIDMLREVCSSVGGEDKRRAFALAVREKCRRGAEAIERQEQTMKKAGERG